VVVGRAQEPEALRMADLQHALPEELPVLRSVRLEQREHQLLAGEAQRGLDVLLFGQLDELAHRLLLQLAQMHRSDSVGGSGMAGPRVAAGREAPRRSKLRVGGVIANGSLPLAQADRIGAGL